MSSRPANVCSLLGMLFLLTVVLLSNLGVWAGPLAAHGVLPVDAAAHHAAIAQVDLVQALRAGQGLPDRLPHELGDDAQCAFEDTAVDQTLGLPEYFSLALRSTADLHLCGHASELPHSSLALELRPPIA
jgi:hypothetical protein